MGFQRGAGCLSSGLSQPGGTAVKQSGGASCKGNVQDGRKRGTDDLCNVMFNVRWRVLRSAAL